VDESKKFRTKHLASGHGLLSKHRHPFRKLAPKSYDLRKWDICLLREENQIV
jgi:hypothetical protein